jgi:O-acetyl-ADP-ribose deacetylase (regulator of RNase III)
MRVPMILNRDSGNPFLAVRAALLSVRYGVLRTELHNGENARDHIRTVAFPGMGTGVGQIPARLCARQMRAALDCVTNEKLTVPSSWAEASEQHQLLYSDRPKRPQ